MIPEEVLTEFGIPDPNSFGNDTTIDNQPTGTPEGNDIDISDSAVEARIAQLFNGQANSNQQPAQNQPEATPAAPEQPAQGQANGQPQQPTDPIAQFAAASAKAFFGENGELNTAKVNDYFLSKGKSFMKFDQPVQADVQATKPAEVKGDPVKDYNDAVLDFAKNYNSYFVGLINEKGFTPEQAHERLVLHLQELEQRRDAMIGARSEIEKAASEYKAELDQIREEKMTGVISRNYAELGDQYKDLIPGLTGTQVLDQFVLNKEYGGTLLERMFLRDNPTFASMKPDEQKQAQDKWLRNLQTNKADFAMVAEYGRAQWMIKQFPALLEYAQGIGATKAANGKEAIIGGPSGLVSSARGSGDSAMEKFFDSVN